jgi:hypothetical protein
VTKRPKEKGIIPRIAATREKALALRGKLATKRIANPSPASLSFKSKKKKKDLPNEYVLSRLSESINFCKVT